jgi:hypothetical protein
MPIARLGRTPAAAKSAHQACSLGRRGECGLSRPDSERERAVRRRQRNAGLVDKRPLPQHGADLQLRRLRREHPGGRLLLESPGRP